MGKSPRRTRPRARRSPDLFRRNGILLRPDVWQLKFIAGRGRKFFLVECTGVDADVEGADVDGAGKR